MIAYGVNRVYGEHHPSISDASRGKRNPISRRPSLGFETSLFHFRLSLFLFISFQHVWRECHCPWWKVPAITQSARQIRWCWVRWDRGFLWGWKVQGYEGRFLYTRQWYEQGGLSIWHSHLFDVLYRAWVISWDYLEHQQPMSWHVWANLMNWLLRCKVNLQHRWCQVIINEWGWWGWRGCLLTLFNRSCGRCWCRCRSSNNRTTTATLLLCLLLASQARLSLFQGNNKHEKEWEGWKRSTTNVLYFRLILSRRKWSPPNGIWPRIRLYTVFPFVTSDNSTSNEVE